jgi:hypothetical protein
MIPVPADPVAIIRIITDSFAEFREWVSRVQLRRAALEQRELDAVRAFQTAVIGTSNYVARLESGLSGTRAQEEELANLWSDAAIAFYGVNDKVSPLLHLKALSWSRPAPWIDEKVVEAGITFDEMNKLLMQLLAKDNLNA